MKKRELKAKVAIVAGWTGGIGFETCKLLARQNVAIILASRKNLSSKNKFNEIKDFSPSSIIAESDLSEWKKHIPVVDKSLEEVVISFSEVKSNF